MLITIVNNDFCIDTTGLQSSTAVVELNSSITVTCIFATGASSTGCQITMFKLDSLQEVFLNSTNNTRPNGSSEVNILIIITIIIMLKFYVLTSKLIMWLLMLLDYYKHQW